MATSLSETCRQWSEALGVRNYQGRWKLAGFVLVPTTVLVWWLWTQLHWAPDAQIVVKSAVVTGGNSTNVAYEITGVLLNDSSPDLMIWGLTLERAEGGFLESSDETLTKEDTWLDPWQGYFSSGAFRGYGLLPEGHMATVPVALKLPRESSPIDVRVALPVRRKPTRLLLLWQKIDALIPLPDPVRSFLQERLDKAQTTTLVSDWFELELFENALSLDLDYRMLDTEIGPF